MQRIESEAAVAGRSLSAEIIYRITEAYAFQEAGSNEKVDSAASQLKEAQLLLREGIEQVQKNMLQVYQLKEALETRLAEVKKPSGRKETR